MAKSLQTSIKKTQTEYGKMFDNVLEGFQVIDFDYRYLYVNEAVAKQGKSTKEALLGHTMLEMYPGIEKTPLFAKLTESLTKRVIHTMENEFAYPDGSKGWFELRIEPIPEGVFILSLDITDKKQVEIEKKALEELKDIFIQTVSHQLRTPLSVIRWNLERILKGQDMSADTQDELLRISLQANIEIIQRINDLILAMDIEKGRLIMRKDSIQLSELLRTVIAEYEAIFEAREIQLEVSYPKEKLPELQLDIKRIREVISKLLKNAITYTKPGGKVEVSLTFKDDIARIDVKDNGIGIPDSEQKNIFGRFYRASNAAQSEPDASGLGLYVAKYFVDMHGGKIGFSSKEGEGSTFWVELPAK